MKRIMMSITAGALAVTGLGAVVAPSASGASDPPVVITLSGGPYTVAQCKAAIHGQMVIAHEAAMDNYVARGKPAPVSVANAEDMACKYAPSETRGTDTSGGDVLNTSGNGIPPTSYWNDQLEMCAYSVLCDLWGAQATFHFQTDEIWAAESSEPTSCNNIWSVFPYTVSNQTCTWEIPDAGYGYPTNYIEWNMTFQVTVGIWWFSTTVSKVADCTTGVHAVDPINCTYNTYGI